MTKLIVWNKDGTINMYETTKNARTFEESLRPKSIQRFKEMLEDAKDEHDIDYKYVSQDKKESLLLILIVVFMIGFITGITIMQATI